MKAGERALVASWLAAIAVGFTILLSYDGTAGREASPPPRWPAASHLTRTKGLFTLVMLLHPGCPCSRSSLHELERLLAHAGDRTSTHVLLVGPLEDQVGLRAIAAAIPGVEVVSDGDGAEARRFGAATSGQVVLYDPGGVEVFHGGLTGSRAHEGDNPGARAVLDHLTRGAGALAQAPVFGCALGEEGR